MNGRKAFIICLAALVALQQPFTVMAAGATTFEEYRSGTLAEKEEKNGITYTEIHIATKEELAALAENCRLDSWSVDKKVILDADIVLGQEEGLVIPTFGGIFEGNGYKIEEINVNKAGSAMGLFRYLQAGRMIKNLTVTGRVDPDGWC